MELAISQADLVSRNDLTVFLKEVAASAGDFVFQLILIAVYVGFLLAEQRHLPAKLASLTIDGAHRDAGKEVIQRIAQQVQSYLGVCTFLSATMAAVTYALLRLLGVEFAGFWALVMFILTYVPTVGAVGVLLPASMALLQLGSIETFFLVAIALGAVHFVLANIVQAVLLGRSLDLSPLAIILSLSFWGLIWGIPGLFLAVPITAALAIVCRHIDGAQWVAVMLAGSPKKRHA
jgi:predicted PurR-regulated permease PerM